MPSPLTATGTWLPVVVSLPSCPPWLSPQDRVREVAEADAAAMALITNMARRPSPTILMRFMFFDRFPWQARLIERRQRRTPAVVMTDPFWAPESGQALHMNGVSVASGRNP